MNTMSSLGSRVGTTCPRAGSRCETENLETPARSSLRRYELPKVPEGYVIESASYRLEGVNRRFL